MAQLDPFLRAMVEKGAQALMLRGGEVPSFDTSDGPRPVSRTVLDNQRVLTLFGELAGDQALARLQTSGSLSLPVTTDEVGVFSAEASVANGAVSVRFTRPEPEATATTPPTASTAAAPRPAPPTAGAGGGLAVDRLLRILCERGGSDLHLSSTEAPICRVDGDLARFEDEPVLDAEALWTILGPLLPDRLRETWEEKHDVDFAHEITGLARFRCNYFMDRRGPGAVFRVIPEKILTVEDLGLSKHIIDLCKLTKGLVLVTGPTGSGKSTTLTAMIDHVNKTRKEHVITIEDPIEFVHQNRECLVNQREVGVHTSGFKTALRAALREDPDIVLVGEMRDLETIAIAIETAETGHLVFATLHTSTAVSTVDRIIDQFPADRQSQIRVMLSESLKGVISQTLCRKVGGGRVAALEVLIAVPAVANLIREGKTFQVPSIMQTGKQFGMVTMSDALVELVAQKKITTEEAYLRSVEKISMVSALKKQGCDLSFLAATSTT